MEEAFSDGVDILPGLQLLYSCVQAVLFSVF